MTVITYFIGYIAIAFCVFIAATKAKHFMSHPIHIRWELYPVPHEGERAAWGGSYLEETDWWKKDRTHSLLGMAKGLAEEMLLLHLTYVHNRDLWLRTYPFHGGLYLVFGAFFLTVFGCILGWMGIMEGSFVSLIGFFANLCSIVGLIAVAVGSFLLLQRRLTNASLKMYSTPEHYFNLLIFGVWAVLSIIGFMAAVSAGSSLFEQNRFFFMHFFTLDFTVAMPTKGFAFLKIYTFALIAFVPVTHMAHFFMKYFTWHSIRWDDTPTLDDKTINEKIGQSLGMKPTWSAGHIKGDGEKTWADIATTNPMAKPAEANENKE